MDPINHRLQEKPYSCGAACLAMVLGIPEREARDLADTRRTGTSLEGIASGARSLGHEAHVIRCGEIPLNDAWYLEAQSYRWPLVLHIDFRHTRETSTGRKFLAHRHHAVVCWQGRLYDPSELQPGDLSALGHSADRGPLLVGYTLINPNT